MRPLKRLLANDGVRGVLCFVGALYIRLVHATTRWEIVRGDVPDAFWDAGKPFILAFWHGRLLMMPYCWRRGRDIEMLISEHRDGRLIAKTVSHFGIDTVTGSSTRGGTAALRKMVSTLKAGGYVGITPDGPRGPRMRASDGIAAVAKLSGVPVIPATYAVARRRVLGTWDRFVVAWPFNRGVIVWGSPVSVPRDADASALDAARRAIEDGLNVITAEADRMVGQAVIDPAPLKPVETTS
ncbi:MAG: lysophospholipid acyltransferase family protein [Rhodospirillales bacterium]